MASNFIDYVKINCKSGKGGAGSTHFRREKFVDKGGPDGGDGGRGGHIILKGNSQLWTLLHLRYQKHIKAENGTAGGGSRSTGAQGKDVIIEVPLGTVVKDAETGEFIAEITENNQEEIILDGGRGGLGNSHFKNSVQQTPRYSQPGEAGLEKWLTFELKVLADVGLVGFPNAGKSTLLSVISAAKPEIAEYPFTTLTPNLGVVQYHDYKSFIIADIPGIIEGAAEGKGLGLRFLRHIERNSILLFIVSAESEDLREAYDTLLNELKKYNPELLDKKRIIGVSKIDVIDQKELQKQIKKLPADLTVVPFSSLTQSGLSELKGVLWKQLE
ncbi:GTPase ObgE [Jiulongibacter sp. NS-SX5]|uniref:GTPase ObgE n=1 Tax=Jiulongibacter sp. NS-SX5 TaxID=3463854 RepID=UPI0040583FAF